MTASHGSAATSVRCGGMCSNWFVANLLLNSSVKEFWKLINISRSYAQKNFGVFFHAPQCMSIYQFQRMNGKHAACCSRIAYTSSRRPTSSPLCMCTPLYRQKYYWCPIPIIGTTIYRAPNKPLKAYKRYFWFECNKFFSGCHNETNICTRLKFLYAPFVQTVAPVVNHSVDNVLLKVTSAIRFSSRVVTGRWHHKPLFNTHNIL